ncbi:MAG: cellulase family glycosylhydrolase [Lachnospiraceae bacterium]|nr:cellulase family glycosylhydrolase [Lachnospiraceae bacterium]
MKKQLWKKALAVTSAAALAVTGLLPFSQANTASAAKATLKLSKTKATVKVKGKLTLKITKKNVKKIKSQTWSSNKEAVAVVNKKGVVTGKKAGQATISVKVNYIAKGGKKTDKVTLKCKVTVKAATTSKDDDSSKWDGNTAISMKVPAAASNVGTEHEISIVGASKFSEGGRMTVRDNGTMRKEKSSQELLATEMGIGINLGNTMEQCVLLGELSKYTEASDFELVAGQENITQQIVDGMHSYGFNTLRVPVSWTSMVANDGQYKINEKMLGRVEEIVNYALNDGMYVIINDHYDYGWWGAFGSWKYDTDGKTKIPDEERRAEAMKRYISYWTQISERFKDYSDHLIFESANEELDITIANGGFNAPINEDGYVDYENGKKGIMTVDEAYETANRVNQQFVDTVRASGGNNEYRHLLIAGCDTNIDETIDARWKMPTDTEANGKTKLMVSVHYYDPWSFCGDDMAGGTYTAENKADAIVNFDKMKTNFVDQGYGVIVGEMGVCNPRQNGCVDWLKDMTEIMAERGCQPVLWDRPGCYFDRSTCMMSFKDVAELYNSLTGSNGKTDGLTENAVTPKTASTLTTLSDDVAPVWSWTGRWRKNGGDNITLDGGVAKSEDITQFVNMASCTDESKIIFNAWGYRTHLLFDWNTFKKPCIRVTFDEVTEGAIGGIEIYTTKKIDGGEKNKEVYEFADYQGKDVILSNKLFNALKEGTYPYLAISFKNKPTITGIYVYDLDK